MHDEIWFDVDGKHRTALAYSVRQVTTEVASSRAQIGDAHSRRQFERLHHLVRLLPGVALGVVEDFHPVIDVLERMPRSRIVMLDRRRLNGGSGRRDEKGDQGDE